MFIDSRRRVFNSLFSLAVTFVSTQPVIAGDAGTHFQNGMISDAFSDSNPISDEYNDAQNSTQDIDTNLSDLSSFPSLVSVGDAEESNWKPSSSSINSPSPAMLRLRFGACYIAIKTGHFTISSHRDEPEASYPVLRDAVSKQTTFNVVDDENLFVSVGSELDLEISNAHYAACKKRFGGKRIAIGRYSLAGTMVSMVSSSCEVIMPKVQKSSAEYIILNWLNEGARPGVENEAGFPILLDSGVFSLPSKVSEETYYIGLKAKITRMK